MRRMAIVMSMLLPLVLLAPMRSAAHAGQERSSDSGSAPLRFVLDRPLYEGGKTRVRLRNRGEVAYIYNSAYEACDMVFRVADGRKFLVPEGTHCDLIVRERIRPGETITLFRWDLDECVEDNWGCTKTRDLDAGSYTMRGWFRPQGGGDWERVTERFRIRRG